MCILDFSLLFKLNYKCDYGKSVYITGDIEPLGNWNPRKSIQLTWSDGHIWSKRLPISHENTKPIEYKYFIAPTDMNAPTFDPLWEQGPNRVINLRSISKLAITLDDEWEHRKVRIALHDQGVRRYMGPSARLYLEVNLGVERKTIAMKSKRQRVANLQQYNFWTASLMIPVRISEFQYKFIVEDEKEKMRNVLAQSHHVFSYRRYCIHANEDTAYLMNGGTLIKFDFSFHLPMGFNQITDQIYVGESPKGEGDIEALASRKIKGVLNLQTEDDMKRYGIDWESLKAHYERLGIKVEHLPIVDMDTDELTLKIQDAADMIHKLIQENGKVYVHCTAGKYRSPHAVIFYLWCYKKYELTKAISLVKSKRRRTKIFEKVFNQKMRM